MLRHKIGKIFLSDSKLSIDSMIEINNKWFGEGLFDLVSYPGLTNKILFNVKKHPLNNYLLYEIDELVDMHKIKEIVVFVSTLEGYPKNIEIGLMNRYPEQEVRVVKYFIKETTIEASFEEKRECFDYAMKPEMFLLCSDGRLIRIMYEYYKEIYAEKFCFHHACQPGATIWMTMSPRSKEMKNIIKAHIDYYQIHQLKNIHHGKDCGRFLQYHCVGGDINSERALKQHKENMLRTWLKFEKMNHQYRGHVPENHFRTLSIYFEFDEKDSILRICSFAPAFNKKIELVQSNCKEYRFDFENYKFIKNEAEEKIEVLAYKN